MDHRKISASARFFVPADRARKLEADLLEWADENNGLRVRRSSDDEITLERTMMVTDSMENGTVSAAVYFLSEIDRMLSELSEFRWFGPVVVETKLLESRDEPEPDKVPGEDLDDDEFDEDTPSSKGGQWGR